MALIIKPELGIRMPSEVPLYTLPERTEAASQTTAYLNSGDALEVTRDDEETVANLVNAYAASPDKVEKMMSKASAPDLTPASLILANSVLKEFGKNVASDATLLRNVVTNKLLIETENPDPKIRIKALELLGKISDVGLFTEKREVTVTHQSADDLRDSLRNKLTKILEGEVVDAEIVDVDPLGVDKQLSAFEYFEPDPDPEVIADPFDLADEWDD